MKTEILDYRWSTTWDLESVLSDPTFTQHIESDYPLVISTLHGLKRDDESVWSDYLGGRRRGKPSELRNIAVDGLVSHVGNLLGAGRQILNVQAACASSLYALYMATLLSSATGRPAVVACADDVNSRYWHWHFNSFGALDQDSGLPFDSGSKGFRMGTGIAAYIIKAPTVKHTLSPIAVVQSYAFYTNSSLVANPGAVDDIVNNITGINYDKIELWNAHATGTPVGDRTEYEYFRRVIKQDIPIVGYKGYLGHCMCASGAVEIAMTLDGKRNNLLLPNKMNSAPIADDSRIITESTSFGYTKMLKTSLGFGGKTAVAEIDLY
jgi:malonyl-ACP decarboxylase